MTTPNVNSGTVVLLSALAVALTFGTVVSVLSPQPLSSPQVIRVCSTEEVAWSGGTFTRITDADGRHYDTANQAAAVPLVIDSVVTVDLKEAFANPQIVAARAASKAEAVGVAPCN